MARERTRKKRTKYKRCTHHDFPPQPLLNSQQLQLLHLDNVLRLELVLGRESGCVPQLRKLGDNVLV